MSVQTELTHSWVSFGILTFNVDKMDHFFFWGGGGGRKQQEKEETEYQESLAPFWKQDIDDYCAKLARLPILRSSDQFSGKNEELSLRNGRFLYNFVQKPMHSATQV